MEAAQGDRPDLPRSGCVYVIFPQAVRRFLPPWINGVTDAVKGSALVSLLGVVDLMLAIQQVIGRTYEPMPLYILGALIYFAINYSLSSLSRRLERASPISGNEAMAASRRRPAHRGRAQVLRHAPRARRRRPRRRSAARSSRSSARPAAARPRCCAASTCSRPTTAARSRSTAVEVGYRDSRRRAPARRSERELAPIRAETGMVFQLFNLFPHLTAAENVMLGLSKVRAQAPRPRRARSPSAG